MKEAFCCIGCVKCRGSPISPTGGGSFAETYRPQYGTGGANVFAPPAEFGSRLYTAETGVLSLPAGMFRVV